MGSAVVACWSSTDTPPGTGGAGSGGSGAGGTGTAVTGAGATGGTPSTGGAGTTGGAPSTGGGGNGAGWFDGLALAAAAPERAAHWWRRSGRSSKRRLWRQRGAGSGGHSTGSGPGNVPVPSGTPGEITVLDWAGFPAAVTYSFDDNDGSQPERYDEMHAIGGRYTYYMVSDRGPTDPGWKKIHDDAQRDRESHDQPRLRDGEHRRRFHRDPDHVRGGAHDVGCPQRRLGL